MLKTGGSLLRWFFCCKFLLILPERKQSSLSWSCFRVIHSFLRTEILKSTQLKIKLNFKKWGARLWKLRMASCSSWFEMTDDRINRRPQTASGLNTYSSFLLPSSFFCSNSVGKTVGYIFAYRFPRICKEMTGRRPCEPFVPVRNRGTSWEEGLPVFRACK